MFKDHTQFVEASTGTETNVCAHTADHCRLRGQELVDTGEWSSVKNMRTTRRAGARGLLTAVLSMFLVVGVAHGQSVTVKGVRLGQPGDRWLDMQQFVQIERATRDKQFGYAVTYEIAGHGDVTIFWPRAAIDFEGKSPRARLLAMKLAKGRLWYPAIVTARSLPDVYRGILIVDAMYAKDARGAIVAFEMFATVASLGASMPNLRVLPTRPVVTAGGRVSSSSATTSGSSAGVTRGSAGAVGAAAAGTSTATTSASTVASRRALARALEKAGHTRPPESAAHHIVAGNAREAGKARRILEKVGIGINEAANGVFLPATRASANPTGAAVHSTLHTKSYYAYVNELLSTATTRAQAEAALAQIREALLGGGF